MWLNVDQLCCEALHTLLLIGIYQQIYEYEFEKTKISKMFVNLTEIISLFWLKTFTH